MKHDAQSRGREGKGRKTNGEGMRKELDTQLQKLRMKPPRYRENHLFTKSATTNLEAGFLEMVTRVIASKEGGRRDTNG